MGQGYEQDWAKRALIRIETLLNDWGIPRLGPEYNVDNMDIGQIVEWRLRRWLRSDAGEDISEAEDQRGRSQGQHSANADDQVHPEEGAEAEHAADAPDDVVGDVRRLVPVVPEALDDLLNHASQPSRYPRRLCALCKERWTDGAAYCIACWGWGD